jgi:hypothetical protein
VRLGLKPASKNYRRSGTIFTVFTNRNVTEISTVAAKKAPADADALRKRTEERAYALWEAEGRPHGHHLNHWCQAEAETTASSDAGPIRKPQKPDTAPNEPKEKTRSRKR